LLQVVKTVVNLRFRQLINKSKSDDMGEKSLLVIIYIFTL